MRKRPLLCFYRSRVLCARDKRDKTEWDICMWMHVVITVLWWTSPHPLWILVLQEMSYFRTLDPVNDALNIISVCVEGREAEVVQSSVMLLRTKRTTLKTDHQSPWWNNLQEERMSHLRRVLQLTLQGAVVRRVSTVQTLRADAVPVIPVGTSRRNPHSTLDSFILGE